jgi:quercetin dioxygenase-like cupin family protein
MTHAETVFQHAVYEEQAVSRINNFTGQDLTSNTFYFKPGQTLAHQQPAGGDEVYVVLQGQGQFFLNNGMEETVNVETGSIMYIPNGIRYRIVNGPGEEMICTGIFHPKH